VHQAKVRLIDLFAGAGGFTLGFQHHFGERLEPVWANDFNADAVVTYNANFGEHCIYGDIVDLLEDPDTTIPNADVVIGGPPCQGFSLLNKNRQDDPRKALWQPYMEVVRRCGARVFVIENVRQLLNSPEHEAIVERSREMGFMTASAVLCAADYGVPQVRYRAFIVGCREKDPAEVFPPLRTHYNAGNGNQLSMSAYILSPQPYRSVRDAIHDLPAPAGTELDGHAPPLDLHFGRNPTELSVKRYRTIPEEGMNRFDLQERAPELTPACWIKKKSGGTDLFGRLWWDRPAFTVRTEFYKPEKGRYLHPEQHRPITHREAARFQSFPDSFVFKGSKIEIAKQIGNAVPPLLAVHVAMCVEALLFPESEQV
jgi:DNA (cytosine-5)-methyltransferase 1